MYTAGLLALASAASATIQGFNYGSTFTDQSCKQQSDFENDFKTSQGLVGASGFTSARLYTMVQCGTADDPISAIPAAISTKTSLLLGLWASGDPAGFKNELSALSKAIAQYGDAFTSIIDGISIGSEDLYRNSPMGIAAKSLVGAEPDTIVDYIKQARDALKGTPLSGAQIGHVDTWTAWVNSSNAEVAKACDWIGVDAYPYFQDTMVNDIASGASLFDSALGQTQSAVGGKPVWVTETGWPVSGKTSGQAEPSTDNAKAYWDDVGCNKLFGKVNTWWFTLQDAAPTTPDPSFGIVGTQLSTTPLYDLSCKDAPSPSSSAGSSSTAAPSASGSAEPSGVTGGSPALGGGSSVDPPASTATAGASGSASGGASPSGASGASESGSSGSSSGSGSGSGSSGTSSGSGSSGASNGSTGSNSTVPASSPNKTSPPIAAAAGLESFSAAVLAVVIAVFAL